MSAADSVRVDVEAELSVELQRASGARRSIAEHLKRAAEEAAALLDALDNASDWVDSGALRESLSGGDAGGLAEAAAREYASDLAEDGPAERIRSIVDALDLAVRDGKGARRELGIWTARLSRHVQADGLGPLEELQSQSERLLEMVIEVDACRQVLVDAAEEVERLDGVIEDLEGQRDQAKRIEKAAFAAVSCGHNHAGDPEYYWVESPLGDGSTTRTCRDCGVIEIWSADGDFKGASIQLPASASV